MIWFSKSQQHWQIVVEHRALNAGQKSKMRSIILEYHFMPY